MAQWINVVLIYALAYNTFFLEAKNLDDDWATYGTFNMNWYLAIGTPLVMTTFISIFVPHIDMLGMASYKSCLRCRDRGCWFDKRNT